jgi:hypothetical protein
VLAARLGDLRAGLDLDLDLLEDPNDPFLAELRSLCAESLGRETLLHTGSNQRGRFTLHLGFKTPHEIFMKQLHPRHNPVALQT